jgi:nitroreductase
MVDNQVLSTLLSRKSVRKFTDKPVEKPMIETIVKAGQQAPFASQLYSVIYSVKGKFAFKAPLWFLICLDANKLELILKERNWTMITNDLSLLLLGLQDASYMAENMVIAAESLGLGSCFLGQVSLNSGRIRYLSKKHKLPKRVLPMVELVMGYPDEEFPVRPRYPLGFTLFEDEYPNLEKKEIEKAMDVMDSGYLAQEYYKRQNAKIEIEDDEKTDTFTFANYSWTEHISRKWGQWEESPAEMLKVLKERGFDISEESNK